MKFRRNTHTIKGEYRGDTCCPTELWQKYGDIIHHLDSRFGMSFYSLLNEIRMDTVNYEYDEMPNQKDIALGLVKLIEAGVVEVVQ